MGRTDIKYDVQVDDVELQQTLLSDQSGTFSQWTRPGGVGVLGCFIDVTGLTDAQIIAGFCVTIPYRAEESLFKVWFSKDGSIYHVPGYSTSFDAYASLLGGDLRKINACEMKILNPDNKYFIRVTSTNTVAIASAVSSDFEIRQVVYQDAFLLIRCAPGNLHRYPTIGGDVKRLMGATGDYSAVTNSIITTLNNDGIQINSLQFNRETGQLQIDVQ